MSSDTTANSDQREPTGIPNLPQGFLDSFTENVAVLDSNGTIVATNDSWRTFARENGHGSDSDMIGVNYLEAAGSNNDPLASEATDGIRTLLRNERESFSLTYPCHSPDEQRWFEMTASEFQYEKNTFITVKHTDVTQRILRQKELEESQERFRQLTDHLETVFWIVDSEYSRYEFLSPYFEELWGRSRDEMKNLPEDFFQTIHPEDRDRLREQFKNQTKGNYEVEYRIVRPDGDVRWVRDQAFPVKDSEGTVERIVGFSHDITERKNTQNSLGESERRFRQMAESIDQGYFLIEPDYTEVHYVNSTAEDLFGVPLAEQYEDPMAWARHVHPEDMESIEADIREQQENGRIEPPQNKDFRIIHPEDGLKWLRVNMTPVKNEDGSINKLVGTCLDVTKEKEAQQKIQEHAELLDTINDRMPGVVFQFRVDPDGNYSFTYMSEGFEELSGVPAEEALDSFDKAIRNVPKADIEELMESINEVVENETAWEHELRFYHPQKGTKWVRGTSRPERKEDGSLVFSGLMFDLTRRKQLERDLADQHERQVQAQKIANIGHWSISLPERDLQWSDETYRILGLDPDVDEARHEDILSYYHEEDRSKVQENLRRAFEDGEAVDFEARIQQPDGATRHVKCYGRPRYDSSGNLRDIFGVFQDITERKTLEKELRESEELHRTTLNNITDTVFITDDDGHFTYVCPNIHYVFGYSSDEVYEMNTVETLLGEDSRPDALEAAETIRNLEETVTDKHGEKHSVLVTVKSVSIQNGTRLYSIRDVTDLKDREEELRRSQDLMKYTEQLASTGGWEADVETGQQRWTDGTYRIHDIDPDSDFDPTVDAGIEYYHPDDRDKMQQAVEGCMTGQSYEIELRLITDEDRIRWVRATGNPVYEDGEIVTIRGAIKDITKEKQTELALRESEQRFRQLAENINVVYYNLEPDYSQANYVSPAYGDIWERDPAEVYDDIWNFMDPIHEDDKDRVRKQKKELVDNDLAGDTLIEYRIVTSDGQIKWIEDEMFGVWENDKLVRIVGYARDVTRRKQFEQELRESELRFRQLADNIDEIFWMFNDDFSELLYINEEQYEEIWGMDTTRLYDDARAFLEGVHPEDREQAARTVEKLTEGSPQEIDIRVNEREDFQRWIHVEGVPIRNNEGEVIRITGTVTDVTERVETQLALEESEERFRQLAENIDSVFWLTNVDKDKMIYISPAYEDIWGRTTESLYENPASFVEAVHPDDRSKVEEAFPKQKTGDYDIEYRIVQPDGEIRWIRDRAYPIKDEDGDVYRIAGVAEDITRTKSLQRERKKYVELVEHSPNFIARTNLDEEITYINQAGLELIGAEDQEEMIGEYPQVLHPEGTHSKLDDLLKTIRSEGHWNGTHQLVNQKTDEIIDVILNGFVINDPETNEPLEYAAVATDITEQIEVKEQLRTIVNEKETLLQEVHHRVKNNLQVILGLLGLQARKLENEEASAALQNSKQRIQSMAMIHQKLYEGSQLTNLNFHDYVEDLLQQIISGQTGITDDVTVRTDIQSIDLDPDTVISCGLIINELVTNSLKHGFDDVTQGEITVEFYMDEELDHHLIVSDNGNGTDVQKLESSDSLGLRLVRNLANDQLHGDIEFIEDDGLTVEVTFPPREELFK